MTTSDERYQRGLEMRARLAFYAGVLPARSAMNIANTVFRSPQFSTSGTAGP